MGPLLTADILKGLQTTFGKLKIRYDAPAAKCWCYQIQGDLHCSHSNSSDLWKICLHRTAEPSQQSLSFFQSVFHPERVSLLLLMLNKVSLMRPEMTETAVLSLPVSLKLWYSTAIPMSTLRCLTV